TWDNLPPHTFLKTLLTFLVFWGKVMVFVFIYIWIRWTLPRFRYDQLMALGWKVMLPLSIAYIVIVAAAVVGMEYLGIYPSSWMFALVMLGLNIVLLALVFGFIDRGRLISPAYSRLDRRDLEKLRHARYERPAPLTPATSDGGAD